MNNAAAAANTVTIATRSRAFSLLDFLMAEANGAPALSPEAACPELATAGAPCCAGDGTTLSTYLAPRQTYWAVDYAGEDFEVGRTYFFRCRAR